MSSTTPDTGNIFYRIYDLAKARQAVSQRTPAAHQQEALNALQTWFAKPDRRGGILVLPTGGGKTFTAVRFLCTGPLTQGYKVLWLAHTHHLLEQALESFGPPEHERTQGYEVGLIGSTASHLHARVVSGATEHWPPHSITPNDDMVFGTLQTIVNAQKRNLKQLWAFLQKAGDKLLVVFDEAHHAPAPTYRHLLKTLRNDHPSMVLLGLTATPTYSDEKRAGTLLELFPDNIIYQVSPSELMQAGILARPILKDVETSITAEFDEQQYRQWVRSYRDIPEGIISRLAENQARNSIIARTYIDNRDQFGKTIIFADRWFQCEQIRGFLIEMSEQQHKQGNGPPLRVGTVYTHVAPSGGSVDERNQRSRDENATVIEAFKQDKLDVIINIRMLTEGTDVPNAQTVFLTRQTTSTILLTQMIGRALRGPTFGGTDEANIVSFVDNWKHLINWAEYNDLDGVPPADGEQRPAYKRLPLRLVSIAIVQQLIQNMGAMEVTLLPFQELLPVGWYQLEFVTAVKQSEAHEQHVLTEDHAVSDAERARTALIQQHEDTEKVQQAVLVFNNEQSLYEQFITMLLQESLDAFETPDIVLDEQHDQIEAWCQQFFSDLEERVGSDQLSNLFHIVRHVAQNGTPPPFYDFEERKHHDLDALVLRHIDVPQTREQENKLLVQEYEHPERYWRALYPDYMLFRMQYDACVRAELFRRNPPPRVEGVVDISRTPPPREPSPELKARVKARDNYRCLCCGDEHRPWLQIDHIIPYYHGGTNKESNLQTLCGVCNRHLNISEVDFRVKHTPLASAPTTFAWLDIPTWFQHTQRGWEILIQRNINFFYQCAAVAHIRVANANTMQMTCSVQLHQGNDPQWLREHLQAMDTHLCETINERQGKTSISLTTTIGDMQEPVTVPQVVIQDITPARAEQVKTRDGRCLCCGNNQQHELEVERIFAYMTDASNLQTICRTCATQRGTMLLNLRQPQTRLVARPQKLLWVNLPGDNATKDAWVQFVHRRLNFFYQCAAVDIVRAGDEGKEWHIQLHAGNDPRWFEPHLDDMLATLQKHLDLAGLTLSAPDDPEVCQKYRTPDPRVPQPRGTKATSEKERHRLLLAITQRGFLSTINVPADGSIPHDTDTSGPINLLVNACEGEHIVLFTDKHRAYTCHFADIEPDGSAVSLDHHGIPSDEQIIAAITLDTQRDMTLLTPEGFIKTLSGELFDRLPSAGVTVGHAPGWGCMTNEDDELIVVSRHGQAIRFQSDEVSTFASRTAKGVKALKLGQSDRPVGLVCVRDNTALLVISDKSYCKRTPLSEYPVQGRGGKGVRTSSKNTQLVAAHGVSGVETLVLATAQGHVVAIPVSDVPVQGSATQGKRMLDNLAKNDTIIASAVVF